MSLEMPSSSQTKQELVTNKSEQSALSEEILFSDYKEHETDWEREFMSVIQDPKVDHDQIANNQDNVVTLTNLETPPTYPEGSVPIAIDDTWSQQFVSEPSQHVSNLPQMVSAGPHMVPHHHVVPEVPHLSPDYVQSVPIVLIEGKYDPEDEGICVVSPPPLVIDESMLNTPVSNTVVQSPPQNVSNRPSPVSSPVKRVSVIAPTPNITVSTSTAQETSQLTTEPKLPTTSAPPSPEKRFFEKNNIMKWVIDDNDLNDIPDLPALQQSSNKRPTRKCKVPKVDKEEVCSKPSTSAVVQYFKKEDPEEDNDEDYYPQSAPNSSSRKRGRPINDSPRKITPKLPRMRKMSTTSESESYTSYASDSTTGMTDDEVSALKYRRMRDLNNEASKRCRENRKQKKAKETEELDTLIEKNEKLKQTVRRMEAKVALLKRKFLERVENPGREIAAARRREVGQRLNISPDIIGSLMVSTPSNLPDINSLWSS